MSRECFQLCHGVHLRSLKTLKKEDEGEDNDNEHLIHNKIARERPTLKETSHEHCPKRETWWARPKIKITFCLSTLDLPTTTLCREHRLTWPPKKKKKALATTRAGTKTRKKKHRNKWVRTWTLSRASARWKDERESSIFDSEGQPRRVRGGRGGQRDEDAFDDRPGQWCLLLSLSTLT